MDSFTEPLGYDRGSDGKLYRMYTDHMSHDAATAMCAADGATLATFKDRSTYEVVIDYAGMIKSN